MSRWFRHYAGMMRDDKLVRVAIRSKQTIERVVWVWGAILESAAEIDDAGRYDVDASEISYFLRADQADVDSILAGLADAGRIASGCVVKWSNRQFASDRSRDRVAAHRERKREDALQHQDQQTSQDSGVTLQKRHGDAPETDTEAETDTTLANANDGKARKRASSAQIEIPEWMPDEPWQAFVEMRRAIPKVPFTVRAARCVIADLTRWHDAGHDVGAILMHSVKNGYRDVFEPKTPPPRKVVAIDPAARAAELDERAQADRKLGRTDAAHEWEREAARLRKTASIGSLIPEIRAN